LSFAVPLIFTPHRGQTGWAVPGRVGFCGGLEGPLPGSGSADGGGSRGSILPTEFSSPCQEWGGPVEGHQVCCILFSAWKSQGSSES